MELLAQLKSLLGAAPLDQGLRQAIERGVAIADPLIKAVPRYEQKLAATARQALAYCHRLAAEIPGPVDINSRVFGESPLVHAFFSGTEQLREMLGKSQAVRDFLERPGSAQAEQFFGLLGMRRHERTVMGPGLIGDRIREEVPQTLLYFADHTLLELSPELETTRQRVGDLAFDSLAKSFALRLQRLREERQSLHTQWELARAGNGAAHRRDLAVHQLETRLRQASEQLAPQRVLEDYLAWMASPAASLRLEPVTLTVDRLGVLINRQAQTGSDGDTISFPELIARDRRRWILMLVRIRRDEVLQALQAFDQSTRYMLI